MKRYWKVQERKENGNSSANVCSKEKCMGSNDQEIKCANWCSGNRWKTFPGSRVLRECLVKNRVGVPPRATPMCKLWSEIRLAASSALKILHHVSRGIILQKDKNTFWLFPVVGSATGTLVSKENVPEGISFYWTGLITVRRAAWRTHLGRIPSLWAGGWMERVHSKNQNGQTAAIDREDFQGAGFQAGVQ